MNPVEGVLRRERKIAVFPIVCADHCAWLLNKDFKDVAEDGKILAQVLEYCYNLYRYDMVLVFSDPYVEAEALGCELEYSPYPRIKSRRPHMDFESKDSGFKSKDRTEIIIESAKILKKNIDAPIFVSIKGPISLAPSFMEWKIF